MHDIVLYHIFEEVLQVNFELILHKALSYMLPSFGYEENIRSPSNITKSNTQNPLMSSLLFQVFHIEISYCCPEKL